LKSHLQSLNYPSLLPEISLDDHRDTSNSQKRVRDLDQAPETDGRHAKRQRLERNQGPSNQYSSLRDEIVCTLLKDDVAGELENIKQYGGKRLPFTANME